MNIAQKVDAIVQLETYLFELSSDEAVIRDDMQALKMSLHSSICELDYLYYTNEFIDFCEGFKMRYEGATDANKHGLLLSLVTKWNNAETMPELSYWLEDQ